MKQICGNCRHYGKKHNVCRAHAPHVFIVSYNTATKEVLPVSAFPQPPLGEEDSCGEWLPADTVLSS